MFLNILHQGSFPLAKVSYPKHTTCEGTRFWVKNNIPLAKVLDFRSKITFHLRRLRYSVFGINAEKSNIPLSISCLGLSHSEAALGCLILFFRPLKTYVHYLHSGLKSHSGQWRFVRGSDALQMRLIKPVL